MTQTMIAYHQWYKKHGVRMLSQLTSPVTSPYMEICLPKNSVFHWFGYEHSDQVGLNQNDQIAKNVEKIIYASNIENYLQEDVVGNPRNLPFITTNMTRDYFMKNKRIRMLKGSITDVHDEKSLVVFNYGLLNDHYKYSGTVTQELDRWLNYHRSVYNMIARLTKQSHRQHFVEIEVPTIIPPLTALMAADKGLDRDLLRKLTTASDWQVSEFFNLIATNYSAYVFKDIARDTDALNKINIILKANSYYAVINLGLLQSFTTVDQKQDKGLQLRVAKRFLTTLLNLRVGQMDLTSDVMNSDSKDKLLNELNKIGKETDAEEDSDTKARQSTIIRVTDDNDASNSHGGVDDPFRQIVKQVDIKPVDVEVLDKQEEKQEEDIDSVVDRQLKDLELEELSNNSEASGYKPYSVPVYNPKDKIKKKALEYQKVGLLTTGEVQGIEKRATKIDSIKDPRDNTKTLMQGIKISKEELMLNTDTEIVPNTIKGLTDKSMRFSSINKMDKQYIDNTLNKDIGNVVTSLQAAGVIVLDYTVERKKDISSDYEIHKVKVHPVGGSESTISFKVPKIKNDGTFTINNTTSRMRKQRVDMPIRKIAPDEVSLTSYYSKLFIFRTARKRFNYTYWLTNEIISSSIGDNSSIIKEVKLNNVYDQTLVAPRSYSAISMRIASFVVNEYTFYFDINAISTNFGISEDQLPLDPINNKRIMPVCKNKKGDIIYLNYQNELVNKELTKNHGRIEDFIGLDTTKIPQDFAEISLLGKDVPIVLVLAYQLGLGNLLATLGVKYSIVRGREKVNFQTPHNTILFNDVKFVYDNTDEKINLILNGLNRLASPSIKMGFYDFDKKNVYNDAFNKLGIPLRYLKEIPLMFDMWVDHITRDILEGMNEPTDLCMLMLRAVELIATDEHPEATDTLYMRDRGYERISGMAFSELVTAMRKYNAKPVNRKNVLELHPDAVWYSILQDQSVIITEESNPVHACKEQEIIVYRGAGGRSSTAMMTKDRKFHKSSIGVTSEANVDNSETGTVMYTTFNPNYTSVRGTSKPVDITKNIEPAKLLSTTSLLSPSMENEDKKIA